MRKGGQDSIKDVGGFVGGHLKYGRRKKGNVLSRSMLTLDMDYGKATYGMNSALSSLISAAFIPHISIPLKIQDLD